MFKRLLLLLVTLFICAVTACDRESSQGQLNFTEDWFSGNIPRWSKYLKEYKGRPALKYLEVGVFEGMSAFWMVENILTSKSSRAVLIDPLFPEYRTTFYKNLNAFPFKEKIDLKVGYSQEILRSLPLNSFDIVYIDGSHLAKDVYLDAAFAWGVLKVGGMLIFDDYPWEKDRLPLALRPQHPIDAFLNAFQEDIEIVHRQWQVFIKKKKTLAKGKKYTRFGSCVYFWDQKSFKNSLGKTIGLDKRTTDSLKAALKNKVYDEPLKLTKELAALKEKHCS